MFAHTKGQPCVTPQAVHCCRHRPVQGSSHATYLGVTGISLAPQNALRSGGRPHEMAETVSLTATLSSSTFYIAQKGKFLL